MRVRLRELTLQRGPEFMYTCGDLEVHLMTMTTKRLLRGLIVSVAFCLITATGRAQDTRFFVMGGGSSILDNRSFYEPIANTVLYKTRYAIGGKGTAGVELPIKKSKTWSFEVAYGFGENNLKLANYNYSYYPTTAYSQWANRINAGLVLRPNYTYRSGRPYLVAGVEYNRFSPTSGANKVAAEEGFAFEPTAKLGNDSMGGAYIGGGMDWKITSKVGLRMDVRDHVFKSPNLGLPNAQPGTPGLAWFPVTGNAQNVEYSIGLVYRFGK